MSLGFQAALLELGDGVSELKGSDHNPRILEYHATTTLRATEDEVPWCSSFVNWCVEREHAEGTKSAAARSWLKWALPLHNPVLGCVVVLSRGANPASGHVGFWVGERRGKVYVLGGNQGDRVSIARFPVASVLAYRGYR